ncbi:hypothetical protein SUNI508_03396 [Seiridium unicorne]|uniref:Uncharacterized protein n=1 Tax=Seiridium unicorne TaxID=138068 RepID=A0ABR2VC70_9PEZI
MQNPGGHSALFGSNRRKRSPRHLHWGREGVRALQRTSRSFECWRAKPDSSPIATGEGSGHVKSAPNAPGFACESIDAPTAWLPMMLCSPILTAVREVSAPQYDDVVGHCE